MSTSLQNQSAPLLIGHYLPAAFAGYYNLPMRLVQYTVEFVGRIGIVTNSNAAELSAKGDKLQLSQLAIYTNRYSLAIFLPLAILLGVYGPQFFVLWVGVKVAAYSAAVLPILLGGYVIAVVGQFSSGMLLIGMGQHQRYALGMLVETVLSFIALVAVIPRYGIVGAAWTVAILMVADRGIYLCYLVGNTIEMNPLRYAHLVYTRPLLSAIPAILAGALLRATILPGRNWMQLAVAALTTGVAYYVLAFWLCAEPQHRVLLKSALLWRWRRLVSLRAVEN